MSLATAAAPAIFALTLFLVLRRPRQLNPGLAALIGAALAWALGVIAWSDVLVVAGLVWNSTLALVGILIISALLDAAGFFRWVALHLARYAGGSGRAIFVVVILLGAAVSGFFTNDSTVLILTPIVYELLRALGFSPRQMLPYLMACGFIADTMSLPLTVSNLTNMVAADYFHLDFARFAARMALPTLFSLATSLAMLYWLYRRSLPATFDAGLAPAPAAAIRDPFLFRAGAVGLVLMMAALVAGPRLGVPVSLVIGAGAALLLAATLVNRRVPAGPVLRQAPWHILVFAQGMYLVVFGLGKAGLTAWLATALAGAAAGGPGLLILGTGLLVTVLSAVMNNLPGLMLGVLAIGEAGAAFAAHPALGTAAGGWGTTELAALAAVIGADIGPKLTPIGSLATLIWMHVLAGKGVRVTWAEYLRVGLLATPPVLLAALLGLWLAARVF